jgi:Icc-related predicted phosphoesterase
MRVLAFADEAPPADPAELVVQNSPDVVVTLGDLEPGWIASLAAIDLPRLGVLGNHDDHDLETLGIRDLHLSRAEVGGWSFCGFEGCVRYGEGPHQYTQEEAAELVEWLPPADVLLCHSPPWGVNDEPDDPVHVGLRALRYWAEQHEPRYLVHGHTTPDPRTQTHRLGPTEVTWVRGVALLDLDSDDRAASGSV